MGLFNKIEEWWNARKRNEEMRRRIQEQTTTQHVLGTNYGTRVPTTNNSYETNRAAAAALGPNHLARFNQAHAESQAFFNEFASSGNNNHGNSRRNNKGRTPGSLHSRNDSNKFNTLNPNNMSGGFTYSKRRGNPVHTRRARRIIRTKRRTNNPKLHT